MSKDPAFLFYPGDYLRDTQLLSESAQIAYDRILCEHIRNICITQQQLSFFTKGLKEDDKELLLSVLQKSEDDYQIEWVASSIQKRRAYSESRRQNRAGHKAESYVQHMENEDENESRDLKRKKKKQKKEQGQGYGEFKRVLLTEQQYQARLDEWGEPLLHEAIRVLDEYCQMKDKEYGDYNVALGTWPIEKAKEKRMGKEDDIKWFPHQRSK